jgi:hypothetical protein
VEFGRAAKISRLKLRIPIAPAAVRQPWTVNLVHPPDRGTDNLILSSETSTSTALSLDFHPSLQCTPKRRHSQRRSTLQHNFRPQLWSRMPLLSRSLLQGKPRKEGGWC